MLKKAVLAFVIFPWFIFLRSADRNPMHPPFIMFDALKNELKNPLLKEIDCYHTCNQCHDVAYIRNHSSHYQKTASMSCFQCHLNTELENTKISALNEQIRKPNSQNCGMCHGIYIPTGTAVKIPETYLQVTHQMNSYSVSLTQGIIFSGDHIANSLLNIEKKMQLNYPWDIHISRQLSCIACHNIKNNPLYYADIYTNLDHLKKDPRKIKTYAEFLKYPDHTLKTSACTDCHDPFKIHKHLPYKERHFKAVDCQACHVPRLYAPVLQSIDKTVITEKHLYPAEIRGMTINNPQYINSQFNFGYRPFLLYYADEKNDSKISAYNLVTTWQWIDHKTNLPIPEHILKEVYFEGDFYRRDIAAMFDENSNGSLENNELVLNTPEKIKAISNKLKQLKVTEPKLSGTVFPVKVSHGIVHEKQLKPDCQSCHSQQSRLNRSILIAEHSPGIRYLKINDIQGVLTGYSLLETDDKKIVLIGKTDIPGRYIFGKSRKKTINQIGFGLFVLSLMGIAIHALLRFIRRFHTAKPAANQTKTIELYTLYERVWHWLMALSVIILIITGLEIHYAGVFSFISLSKAVYIHNAIAYVLLVNSALSLFYHLITGKIRHYFYFSRKFLQQMIVQSYYYVYGMFNKAHHPFQKTVGRKLNPLQQLTYFGLLNILIPFQIATGLLIMGAEKWPDFSELIAGLTIIAPLHNLGSWLFISFLVIHIYLTTTGKTLFSNLKAMIHGNDDVSPDDIHPDYHYLIDLNVLDLIGTILSRKKTK
jgi:thiosulfate reductase cytochrome b subunit